MCHAVGFFCNQRCQTKQAMRLDKKDIAKMKKEMMLLSGLLLAFAATPAMAGGFIRGEIGRSDVNIDVDGFGDDSDNDTSYSIRGGWFFNNNFAVEGFYSSF